MLIQNQWFTNLFVQLSPRLIHLFRLRLDDVSGDSERCRLDECLRKRVDLLHFALEWIDMFALKTLKQKPEVEKKSS